MSRNTDVCLAVYHPHKWAFQGVLQGFPIAYVGNGTRQAISGFGKRKADLCNSRQKYEASCTGM